MNHFRKKMFGQWISYAFCILPMITFMNAPSYAHEADPDDIDSIASGSKLIEHTTREDDFHEHVYEEPNGTIWVKVWHTSQITGTPEEQASANLVINHLESASHHTGSETGRHTHSAVTHDHDGFGEHTHSAYTHDHIPYQPTDPETLIAGHIERKAHHSDHGETGFHAHSAVTHDHGLGEHTHPGYEHKHEAWVDPNTTTSAPADHINEPYLDESHGLTGLHYHGFYRHDHSGYGLHTHRELGWHTHPQESQGAPPQEQTYIDVTVDPHPDQTLREGSVYFDTEGSQFYMIQNGEKQYIEGQQLYVIENNQATPVNAVQIHRPTYMLRPSSGFVASTPPAELQQESESTTEAENQQPDENGSPDLDVTGDGTVDNADVALVALALTTNDLQYDVNGDGTLNVLDILFVLANSDEDTPGAPTIVGDVKLSVLEINRIKEQIDLLVATEDRSPAAMWLLTYLRQLVAMAQPDETRLLSNYPNPFNPETWIPYQLSEPAEVTLRLYSAKGELVRTLGLGYQPVGIYHSKSRAAYWDGRNAQGEQVATGIYFYTLSANDFTATRKMLILK